jgi:hypothetical protein
VKGTLVEFWRRTIRRGSLRALVAAPLVVLLLGTAAHADYAFDAKLSLTGGCSSNKVDPEPDPGCPGGVHPSASFSAPTSVTTDSYGNIFVASFGSDSDGKEGRIDVFDAEGFFIEGSELAVPKGPRNLAVDSKGFLYVYTRKGELQRYDPAIEPGAGKVKLEEKPTVLAEGSFLASAGLEIGPEDHLFVHNSHFITEYDSATEGNKFVEEFGEGTLFHFNGLGFAIDKVRKRIYASDKVFTPEGDKFVIRVFELEDPHGLIETIDEAATGKSLNGSFSIAADEGTGHIFVYDGNGAEAVFEFTEDGEYVSTIDRELNKRWVQGAEIAIDNGANSPNGVLNPLGRYLYVPAFPSGVGHSFAFSPPEACPPVVESVSFAGVSEDEALLQAEVEPCFLETSYIFEYTTQQSFEAEGFAAATVAGEGKIPAGNSPVDVAASAKALEPGTAYRFRVVVENEEDSDEAEREFATYPQQSLPDCPNDPLRIGFSALLPDCRAYELVTPPDTNARSPIGLGRLGTLFFASRQASPSGEKVSFQIEGGLIPGSEGTGSLGGDPYLTTRTEDGWSSALAGPNGAEVDALAPGSTSPDQEFSFWGMAGSSGSAAVDGKEANYVRYPDGHSALIGRGSLATDPRAQGVLISEGGGHIVFFSGGTSAAIQLEPNAPPDGTWAIYDRTPDEVTHVVSLLPGDVTPSGGQSATYLGASLDGEGIAFSIGGTLYLRHHNDETYEVGAGVIFAGVAAGGDRIFYVQGGNLKAFDVDDGVIEFSDTGDVTVVNVSADGTAAYFVSPSVIPGSGSNPNGASPQAGEENLYLSREGTISFVGTVTERDVEGENISTEQAEGLGLWTNVVSSGKLAADPSRTTPDGSVLLFESRAVLDGYDPEGHAQIYRYDSVGGELDCLSCNPTLAPAIGEASLQSLLADRFEPEPLPSWAVVANLRSDGRRAFFQTEEALVSGDTDALLDVYEWEEQGVGSCTSSGGCVYLISSGHSARIDYLYAVSDSGDDVFFRSSDLLLGIDTDETPSIYDARVGGGFPEEGSTICEGEGCRPSLAPPPLLPPSESGVHETEQPPPAKTCPKGKRKVKRDGKVRCVKKKQSKQRHHKAGSKRKGAGK